MQNLKKLHPNNIHNTKYNLAELAKVSSGLEKYIKIGNNSNSTIDFDNPKALIELNKALLLKYYGLTSWELPDGHLCPAIPGRANYIHYLNDLIEENKSTDNSSKKVIKVLDIGTGAGCIYPILGHAIYGWKFVATDISSNAINSCKKVIRENGHLKKFIGLRFQKSKDDIFKSIIKSDEFFEATMCNPPFYSSLEEADEKSNKKKNNLSKKSGGNINHNNLRTFGGYENELWCEGGELSFIKLMIEQSTSLQRNCRWFTTLVSSKENLILLKEILTKTSITDLRIIKMETSNKISHILAWSFI
ncbi:23S rRNA (adenine(1618)-N(6))-methyltransferase RlmF [Halobacteriovorax sp. HLS]|uniref:23S rRNA (adenine(1618)-N(6))-methyltransferase RlmF n=1 Tax=Halobacteriovorax sp. HLS TaxID=2234000 RepID=UPI000FD794CD|nr:23S rRNA (adenine(1618)-N(6))-methyltransferase RlmF [Halobacteriovorax sp. HLS]